MGQSPSSKADYTAYALAHSGVVEQGSQVFSDAKGLCATCHTVDGSGAKAGPDLYSIGDKFSRNDLIRSILEPSATVAVGFGATVVETTDGDGHIGVIRAATEGSLSLMGVDGNVRTVATKAITKREESTVSLMPEGLHAAMSLDEFADLITYLESLKTPSGGDLGSGTPADIPVSASPLTLTSLFPPDVKFREPTWMGFVPGLGTHTALVLEQAGKLWIVEEGRSRSFLDLTGMVRRGGATGLLACAFHPDFVENRRYCLKYQIVEEGVISTIIEERRFSKDGSRDSGDPPRPLLKIRGVTQDHNGGSLGFGPDGYLYVGMGDTGPQEDPQGHGQDMGLLLGKIIRIDIDRSEAGKAYAIPEDNPFRMQEGIRPEIWALGFREPWRLSWDRETGDLWVGDVGQNRYEEVAIVSKGENHGWNVYEGHHTHSDRYRKGDGSQYVAPVISYGKRHGVSVTGGYVYRGKSAPRLRGWYVFGDFESRRLWALTQRDRTLTNVMEIGRSPTRITSFTEDENGELYLVGYDNGIIYRMRLDKIDPRPRVTRSLTSTSESEGIPWQYHLQKPEEGWAASEFDDTGWSSGLGGFGTANTPGAIVRTEWSSSDIWLRRAFDVSSEELDDSDLLLRFHHDEDVEVFLNGVEVLRQPRWTTGYQELRLTGSKALRAGRNVIAVHCHQNGGGQYIDVGLYKIVRQASNGAVEPSR